MPPTTASAAPPTASAPLATLPTQNQQQHKTCDPHTNTSQHEDQAALPAGAQEDAAAAELKRQYRAMVAAFAQEGLDGAAVAAAAAWFDINTPAAGVPPQPLFYTNPAFPPNPLPPAAVRLLLVPLALQQPDDTTAGQVLMGEACRPLPEATAATAAAADLHDEKASNRSQAVLAAAALAVCEVQQLLPSGCQVFVNPPSALHITLFHFSHPRDTRPNTLLPSSMQQGTGGVLTLPPSLRPGPTPAELAAEQAATAAVVAAAPPFVLQLERVVMTRSGTLLLTWLDVGGEVARLRAALSATFPGGSTRQANIVHTSLLRIVAVPAAACGQQQQLPPDVVQALSSLCESLSTRLRGLRLRVSRLQWVVEEQFSTTAGEQVASMMLGHP